MALARDFIRSCIRGVAALAVATGGLLAILTATVVPAGATSSKPLSIVSSPNPSSGQSDRLVSVSCPSATSCIAVGRYFNSYDSYRTLAEVWNGTTWSIVASPNPSRSLYDVLQGVSCSSTTSCMAVGYYYNGTGFQALAEVWNGTTWSIPTTPNASPSLHDVLNGVSCSSTTSCIAVGYDDNGFYNYDSYRTLVEIWNGTTWSIVASPNASTWGENALNGVSCASASFCTAVGFRSTRTLVETWNGRRWSIAASPNPSGSRAGNLFSVSCTSAASCTAVGTSGISNLRTFAESWNGTTWSLVSSPNASPSLENALYSVSCTSAASCIAVGYYSNNNRHTLTEAWNGTSWSIVASPDRSGSYASTSYGVSCTSTTLCTAVGRYHNSNDYDNRTLVEVWNGTTWSLVSSPNLSGSMDSFLRDVSCVTATFCTAVGGYLANSYETLIETWNGTHWSIVASPNTSSSQNSSSIGDYLSGVSCTSTTSCTAVGASYNIYGFPENQTLIETWNGTSWSIVASPNTSSSQDAYGLGDYLFGVSCVSATSCTAVGASYNTSFHTLVETWNGATWSIAASPDASASQNNVLYSASCVSTTSCTAVGYYNNGMVDQTLVEAWNGTTWSIPATPNTSSSENNVFDGVSCSSATSCIAVGHYFNSALSQTLAERWNGTSWSIVASPDTSNSESNYLSGVSCMSASSCTAVGTYYNGSHFQTLFEVWNATSWSVAESPNTSRSESNYLFSVSCTSATSCTAVGHYQNGRINIVMMDNPPFDRTLIETGTPVPTQGYWLVASGGGLFSFYTSFYGSMSAKPLTAPIVGMASTPDGRGYWEVAANGNIFSFGDAKFFGSMGARHLSARIVGMASTPDGKGYWEVAADGGIFSFGDAKFFGSMGGMHLNKPIVGMAATPDGKGYWMVAADGGIFSFGDAKFYGSMGARPPNTPVAGIAAA